MVGASRVRADTRLRIEAPVRLANAAIQCWDGTSGRVAARGGDRRPRRPGAHVRARSRPHAVPRPAGRPATRPWYRRPFLGGMSIHQDMPSPRRPSPRRRASGRRRASARRRSPRRCSPAGRRRTSGRMIRRKSPRRYRGTSKHFIISLDTGWVDQPWTSLQMETSDGVWYTDAIASIGDLTKEGKKANITQSELVDAFADWERWSVEEKIRQLIVFWTGRTDLTLARPAHILPEDTLHTTRSG